MDSCRDSYVLGGNPIQLKYLRMGFRWSDEFGSNNTFGWIFIYLILGLACHSSILHSSNEKLNHQFILK